MTYRIVLFGPQGSGKGTQADLLAQKLALPKVDTGNLWRQEIASGTELGRAQEERQSKGMLALDAHTNELIARRLHRSDMQNGFIIDGYPRSRAQLTALDQITSPNCVVYLKLSDAEALKRLAGRLFCKKCGRTYHVVYNPPAQQLGEQWFCDDDKTALIVREDDKPEAIKQRLDMYHEQTEPIIDLYRTRGIVSEINAAQSIEKVQEDIMTVLKQA